MEGEREGNEGLSRNEARCRSLLFAAAGGRENCIVNKDVCLVGIRQMLSLPYWPCDAAPLSPQFSTQKKIASSIVSDIAYSPHDVRMLSASWTSWKSVACAMIFLRANQESSRARARGSARRYGQLHLHMFGANRFPGRVTTVHIIRAAAASMLPREQRQWQQWQQQQQQFCR